jgi:hypothetical protein
MGNTSDFGVAGLVVQGPAATDGESGAIPAIEAWPERTDRRIALLEERVVHLERMIHRLLNADEQSQESAG